MISISGASALAATAIPEISPPPPIGTTIVSRSGTIGEQFERDRPLAGDDRRIVIGMDKAEPLFAG